VILTLIEAGWGPQAHRQGGHTSTRRAEVRQACAAGTFGDGP
jgi:hypothetical protein